MEFHNVRVCDLIPPIKKQNEQVSNIIFTKHTVANSENLMMDLDNISTLTSPKQIQTFKNMSSL